MSGSGLSLYEKETIITYNESPDAAEVFTYNSALMRKLDKLCEGYPEQVTCLKVNNTNGAVSKEYTVPRRWIKVNAPKKGRELTEEERAAMAERLRLAREKKQAEGV